MRIFKILLCLIFLGGFVYDAYPQKGVATKVVKKVSKSAAHGAEKRIAEKMAAKGFKRTSMNFADRAVGEQFIKKAAREKVCELMEKQGLKSFLSYGNHMAAKEIRKTGASVSKKRMLALSKRNGYRTRMAASRKEARLNRTQYNNTKIAGRGQRIPKSHGTWSGEPGNSIWKPDLNYVPKKNQYSNPDNLTWGQILKKYGIDGIPFKNGVPDFKALSRGEVTIDDIRKFLKGGTNREELHEEAFKRLAKQRKCSVEEVRKFKEKNNLVWHEDVDCKTLMLVPREIHDNIPHIGGVSIANRT